MNTQITFGDGRIAVDVGRLVEEFEGQTYVKFSPLNRQYKIGEAIIQEDVINEPCVMLIFKNIESLDSVIKGFNTIREIMAKQ